MVDQESCTKYRRLQIKLNKTIKKRFYSFKYILNFCCNHYSEYEYEYDIFIAQLISQRNIVVLELHQ